MHIFVNKYEVRARNITLLKLFVNMDINYAFYEMISTLMV